MNERTVSKAMKTTSLKSAVTVQPPSRHLRSWSGACLAGAALVVGLLLSGPALGQSDDFNDGNDHGWTRYDPIGSVFGSIATFSFPNGAYRIRTAPSPAPTQVGPGRAGSLRLDVTYTDFFVAVDVVGWDPSLDQAFGLLARVRQVGLGTTDGYAMTWAQDGQDIDITRFTNEDPTGGGLPVSGNDKVSLVPGRSYRFVFIGKGPQLTGRVYELPNITTPVAEITGTDSTYTEGYCGLVLYDNTSAGNGRTDATFDNYLALPEEPPRLSYLVIRETGEFQVSWPTTFTGYILESSPVLPAVEWTPEEVFEGTGFFYHWEGCDQGNKFFRLRKPAPALGR